MITKSTTLILGAGASIPYGFPSGAALNKLILENLYKYNYDTTPASEVTEYKELLDLGFKEKLLDKFKEEFEFSGRTSIDAFLEHRKEFTKLGKILICQALLKCEDYNKLFDPKEDNWYEYIWNHLNTDIKNFKTNKLSIITFNYDRSFEFYFLTVIKNAFGLSEIESWSLLQSIKIIHLHGKLGHLKIEGKQDFVDYAKSYQTVDKLINASKSIKIIHDEIMPSEEFSHAYKVLEETERLYILGFGYNSTNVNRLKLDDFANHIQVLNGTYLGLTKRELVQNVSKKLYTRLINERKSSKNLEFLRNMFLN